MTQDRESETKISKLRRHAESALAGKIPDASDISTLSHEDIQNLVHELQVHQIELEMQNEEQRTAQIALEKSMGKYLDLYDFSPVGYFTLDRKGIILEANLTGVRLLGIEKESLINRPLSRFVCREDADTLYLHINRVFENADKQTCEIRIVRKDGSEFHAQLDCMAIQDGGGQLRECRMVITDITDRKKAGEALRDSELRYGAFLNSTADLAFLKDEEFRYVMVNKANLEFFGKTEDEIIGKTDFDVMPLSLAEDCRRSDVEALNNGGIVVHEESVGQRVFETKKFVVMLENGKKGLGGLIREVTDRKRGEQELKEAKDFLDRIINAIADPVFVKNEKHEWVLLNEAYCNFMGYSHEELVGKSDHDFFPSSEAEVFWEKDEIVLRTGQENVNTEKFTDRKGVAHTIVTKKSLHVDPSGKRYLVGVIRDITESERADADRRKLESQLQQSQKMEAIGTLAGGIAHDFNNLLQVTLGYSELLLSEKTEKDADYVDLQKIHQAARSGAELVRNLLTFSRKAEPRPVPMKLNNEIRHVERLLHRTIPRMIDIQLDLAEDLERIKADRAQIEQIIMNLTVNARDAMGDEGSLKIRTENVTLDHEYCRHIVGAKQGDYVLLSVSDTGHGMDAKTVEHIFEPFFTTKEIGRGTGLGLATVYGIVKQHGGHITCHSEVGQGTTFKLYFPVIPAIEEPTVEATGIMPAFGTETLLLVDDEDLVRELGERILKRSGYKVLTATNGGEALEVYAREKQSIALVILDLIMPTMGGKECLKELVKIDPQATVLIASGYGGDASVRECVELGATGFVAKPFRFKELLQQVRKALDET